MDNSTQDRDDLLMRYLDDEMDDSEKESFERWLRSDAELKEELGRLQLARAAISSYGLKKEVEGVHVSMMKEMRTSFPASRPPLKKLIRYSIAIAASFAALFVAIQGYNFVRLSPERLYNQNYIAYEADVTRGSEETLSPIEKAYREKKYSELTKTVYHRSLTPRETFLRGMAFLQTGDYSRAVTSFQSIISDTTRRDLQLKDETEYYLSLAYLGNRDYDEAIELMEQINENPGHTYNERISKKFIRKVKMLKWR